MKNETETVMDEQIHPDWADWADGEWVAEATEEASSEWGDYYDTLHEQPEWI